MSLPPVPFTLDQIYEAHGPLYNDADGNRIKIGGEITEQALASMAKVIVYQWVGSNNRLVFGSLDFPITGRLEIFITNNSLIRFGRARLMADMRVFAAENAKIKIGEDGMFASDVEILGSNVHTIFDRDGRPNSDKRTTIGAHVWLGKGTRVLAGAEIGTGTVIGAYSIVATQVPNNCVAAGNPCRVVKRDTFWSQHRSKPVAMYAELAENFQDVNSAYIGETSMTPKANRRRWRLGKKA